MSFTHHGAFIVHSEGRSAVIDSNSTLLIDPDSPYWMSRHVGPSSRGAYFLIRPDVFREIVGQSASELAREGRSFSKVRGPSSTRSYLLQRLILERAARSPLPEALEIDELVLVLVAAATGAAEWSGEERSGVASQLRTLELVERVRMFLVERVASPVRLDEIAKAVRLSPFHLCRLFKRATGFTLHRYQASLRLRSALDSVANPSVDLGEVAIRFGYSSHSHFTAAFRKEFGASPSEIRKKKPRELLLRWREEAPRPPASRRTG
jgi:AraC-like DNA-binding protein